MPRHTDKRLRLTRMVIEHGQRARVVTESESLRNTRTQPAVGKRVPRGSSARSAAVPALDGPFQNECRCGLPWCTWTSSAQADARRGTTGQPRGSDHARRRRTGAWRTPDGRFVLEWTGQEGRTSRSKPNGWLRVFDCTTARETYAVSMREARVMIAKLYDAGADAAQVVGKRKRRRTLEGR